jgi:hypothetical protein
VTAAKEVPPVAPEVDVSILVSEARALIRMIRTTIEDQGLDADDA